LDRPLADGHQRLRRAAWRWVPARHGHEC
jgi:hypothetical protein